jgi:hypothetical protein
VTHVGAASIGDCNTREERLNEELRGTLGSVLRRILVGSERQLIGTHGNVAEARS